MGILEPHKVVDLVMVDEGPMKDLRLFERGREKVVLVMKDGKIIKDIL